MEKNFKINEYSDSETERQKETELLLNNKENELTEEDKLKLQIFEKHGITNKMRKIDLMIIIFITFMGMICYSVVLPSIALYLDDVRGHFFLI